MSLPLHEARIMISLLSDQRMLHVIPLLQQGLSLEHVILVGSGREENLDEHFIQSGNELISGMQDQARWTLHKQAVDPVSPAVTAQVVASLIQGFDTEKIVVNVTGGTKPMSIGAYQAAIQLVVPALYVDSRTERLLIYHDNQEQYQEFNLHPISVRSYLRIHGKELDEERTQAAGFSEEELDVAKILRQDGSRNLTRIMVMRGQARKAPHRNGARRIPESLWRDWPRLVDGFQRAGWLHRKGDMLFLQPQGLRFLQGEWLESYVFVALKESGRFMDVQGRVYVTGAENELDVACTMNAKLGIVECKSSDFQGQAILNRLLALRATLAGAFGRTYFVTTRHQHNLSEVTQIRAAEYISQLVDLEDLENVDTIIASGMGPSQGS